MTEHLVRRGLGVTDFANPADLVPHFKRSLRQLLADGEAALPDHPMDTDWDSCGDVRSLTDERHYLLKCLLGDACTVQYYIHGMFGSYTLRFSPFGSDQLWGFPFDKECMTENNAAEIPSIRPGEAGLPPVGLVSDPMLVVSGLDGQSYDKDFTVWSRMQVVTPWVYGGEKADIHRFPGFEKGWKEHRANEQKGAELGEGTRPDDRTGLPLGAGEDQMSGEAQGAPLVAEKKGKKRKRRAKKAKKTAKKASKATKKTRK
jgi:hypothetical protein